MSSPPNTSEGMVSLSPPPASSPHCWFTRPLVHNPQSAPCARHGHAMTYALASAWVFGGVSETGAFLGDLHRLDIDPAGGMTWNEIQTAGQAPSARAGHIFLPLGRHTGAVPLSLHGHGLPIHAVDKLLCFGGVGSAGSSNELFVLDLKSASGTPSWHQVHASGPEVQARHHAQHQVLCQADGSHPRLIISGGEDRGTKVRNTVSLDLATWTWTRSDMHEEAGVDLARSAGGAFVQSGRLAVVGGETEGNVTDMKTLLFHAAELHNPAITVTLCNLDKRCVVPPVPRSLFTLTTVRSDGSVLVDENKPNTLAPGATQDHLGAMHKRGSLRDLNDSSGDRRASRSKDNGTAPGEVGVSAAASGSSSNEPGSTLTDSVPTSAYMMGGCSPTLAQERRFGEVWRIVLDDDDDDPAEVHHGPPTAGTVLFELVVSEGPLPIARADHAAVAIPSGAASLAPGSTVPRASGTNRILFFGGSIGPHKCTNDLQILEISESDGPTFSGETHASGPGSQAQGAGEGGEVKPVDGGCCVLQ